MRKVKQIIPTNEWQDIITKYAPDDSRNVNQNSFTNGTKNIDTKTDGTIRKMQGGIQFATLANGADDQHEAIFSDGARHLLVVENGILKFTSGTSSMTTVTSGYSTSGNFEFATTKDRVYFGNGINPNQVYDKTASYGGVGYSVPQTKNMGAQVPSTTLTAALAGSGTGVPAGGHTYKVTYLYYDSEESNGSAASNLVTVPGGGEDVNLTSIPVGGYGVTARKIYRDNNDGNYVLITTINDNTTTIYTDQSAGGTTPIPSDNGIPPVAAIFKLFSDRVWLGQVSGEPFTLYFSEVGLPDIFESTNFIECNPEDPITGLAVYRGRLVVFNRNSMGQILGSTRDSFRYDSIEGSVGCVDSRSIQEVVIDGVPVLVWLSSKGMYAFNGASILYISDSIENIINSDIKQIFIQRNQHVDTSNADFNAGTASDGIDVLGGQVSVRGYVDGTSTIGNNPRRTWNDTSDWDGGTLDNISTIDQSNSMVMVENNFEAPGTSGSKDNVIANGDGIKLQISSDFTGEGSAIAGTHTQTSAGGFFVRGYYQRFIPDRSGTVTQIRVSGRNSQPSTTFEVGIMAESGGQPDRSNKIATTNVTAGPFSTPAAFITAGLSGPVTGGTAYWIYQEVRAVDNLVTFNMPFLPSGNYLSGNAGLIFDDFGFRAITNIFTGNEFAPAMDYTMVSDPASASGTWTGTIIDTQSTSADPATIDFSATYPAGTGSTAILQGGDALDFAGNLVVDETQEITDNSGSTAITLGSRRYYQVKITLTTDDDRVTPTVDSDVDFVFDSTATWESEAIDTTGDSTVYNALTATSATPGGSTATTEIRTSDTLGGLSGETYVAFGSVTVRKYAQIRVTFTKSGPLTSSPSVSNINFTWTIVSNLISEAIDTAVDPSGWDVFTADFATNGGTVLFEQRSATTEGGLSGATWYTVTSGNFPTSSLPTDQWIQWRVTLTVADGSVPTVSSVTTKWLIGDTDNIRAASIFHDKSYYLSLAEFGNNENNIILQFDENGKWRIKRGLGVATFGFFFNEPYFGSSTSAIMGKFLEGFQDLGTDIEIDIRTKAFDFSTEFFDNSEFEKIPESIIIEGRGTGATYDVSYSLDNGATFTNFIDVVTGSTTYTTTNNDALFARVFRVDIDTNGLAGARTIMYRVHTNDEYDIKLHRVKVTGFLTRREPIITG